MTTIDAPTDAALRRGGLDLVAVSFVVLFQELALIRWLAAQVRVLAYFPNIVLISAFAGLGVGCLLARRVRSLIPFWPAALLVLLGSADAMSRVAFTSGSVTEHLWLLYYDLPHDAPVVHAVWPPILIVFVLSAASFVPLGQFVADRLRVFRDSQRSLAGYACDLTGSLAGTIAFAVVSFLSAPAIVWFVIITMASLLFLVGRRNATLAFVLLVLTIGVVQWADTADAYSPYYALRRIDVPGGFIVLANGSQHQYAASLRRTDTMSSAGATLLRYGYHLPYGLLAASPARVLILGAGTGNDVAVALDEGAQHVDAVEIDPVILRYGALHPDHPYSDPRVRVFNTDARSFLNNSTATYDLVVFGTLDSMTRLSALSNVRLDNFVYTRECFAAAKRHLAPGGGMALLFGTGIDYIDARFRSMLTEVFGTPPAVVVRNFGSFNRLYLAGPAYARLPRPSSQASTSATDDWPYLYLRSRALTPFYLGVMISIALIALIAIAGATGGLRRFDGPMFFFGLAFLLLETKSVTQMSLLWGSTWLTNAIVFASILIMVLGGTLLMRYRPVPLRFAATGLVLSLLVNWGMPVEAMLVSNTAVKALASILFVGLPVFFASISFALLFRDEDAIDLAFGWNLLGAVAGGLTEFTSMLVGFRALALIALAAYVVAFALTPSLRSSVTRLARPAA
jgi:spermidine synthase